ncbi:MAG: hypothetical protein ACYCY6_02490 [Minisyncoccota bacterium]
MRIWYSTILLILTITTPSWVYLPMIFIGIMVFSFYIESVFLGLLVDILYGGAIDSVLLGFPFGSIGALLTLIAIPLRRHLRFRV